MALENLLQRIENKKIVILGFGKEGVSTYRFIRRHFPKKRLVIADGNENLKTDEFDDKYVKFIKGKGMTAISTNTTSSSRVRASASTV